MEGVRFRKAPNKPLISLDWCLPNCSQLRFLHKEATAAWLVGLPWLHTREPTPTKSVGAQGPLILLLFLSWIYFPQLKPCRVPALKLVFRTGIYAFKSSFKKCHGKVNIK